MDSEQPARGNDRREPGLAPVHPPRVWPDHVGTTHQEHAVTYLQFRPPFGEWGLVDIDGSEVRPNDADPECSIVGHVPEWDEYGGKHCVRCWENLSFVPRTPEQIERSRAIWAETTAALNRLLPEIKAASEKILADGQRLGTRLRRGVAMSDMDPIRCQACMATIDLAIPQRSAMTGPEMVATIIERATANGWRVLRTDPIGCGTCPTCLGTWETYAPPAGQTFETYDPDRPRTTLDDIANLNEALAGFGVAASKTFRLQALIHWGEGGGEAYIPAAQLRALTKEPR